MMNHHFDAQRYYTSCFFFFATDKRPLTVEHRNKSTLQFKNMAYLVRKGATDGTKTDEEAKTVARRMAWNFMVVICVCSDS